MWNAISNPPKWDAFDKQVNEYAGAIERGALENRTFAKSIKLNFKNNVNVAYQDVLGEIDLLSDNGDIYEIKCVNEINIKHILQVIAYNVMQNNYTENEKHKLEINFYNLYRGLQVTYILETEDVHKIIKILQEQINKVII